MAKINYVGGIIGFLIGLGIIILLWATIFKMGTVPQPILFANIVPSAFLDWGVLIIMTFIGERKIKI